MKQSVSEAIAEAESKPLEFNPSQRATYIRTMLKDITNWMNDMTENDIRQKVPEFVELYPELFKKIMKGNDLEPVQNMLAMLDRMGDGRLSQHQASVIVGKNLADRYVMPVLK